VARCDCWQAKRRLKMQLNLWLKDTQRTCNVPWIFIIHKPSSEVHWNTEARISKSPKSHLWKSRRDIQGSFLVFDNRIIVSYNGYTSRLILLWINCIFQII
jgi:hypothetical protein